MQLRRAARADPRQQGRRDVVDERVGARRLDLVDLLFGRELVVDRTGIWELDPLGTGIVQSYSVQDDVLRSLAPIQMVPRKANGDPGEIRRFGSRVAAGGGVDCDESEPFGTYRWSVSGDALTFTALREPCGQRRAVYEGTWTRVY